MVFHCLCLILVSFFILSETKQPNEKDAIEWLKVVYRYPELRLIHNDFNNLKLPYYLNYENSHRNLGNGTVGNSPKIPSELITLWKKGISDIIPEAVKEFIIITNNSSPTGHKCGDDILYTISRAMVRDTWALQMLDASGKPSAGIMLGGVTWLGNEKECKEVYAPATTIGNIHFGGFNGIQCLVDWSLNIPPQLVPGHKVLGPSQALEMGFWNTRAPKRCVQWDFDYQLNFRCYPGKCTADVGAHTSNPQ